MDLVLPAKQCFTCGEVKPLSEFYRKRDMADKLDRDCKQCVREYVKARAAFRRAEMGEEAWLQHQSAIVAKSRQRTGNAAGRRAARARNEAIKILIERHRVEFDRLVLLGHRGELPIRTETADE